MKLKLVICLNSTNEEFSKQARDDLQGLSPGGSNYVGNKNWNEAAIKNA